MDTHAVSDFGTCIEHYIWEKVDILAELAIGSDVITPAQNRSRANVCAIAHNTERSHISAGIYLGRFSNNRCRMDRWRKNRLGKEDRHGFGKGNSGVWDP